MTVHDNIAVAVIVSEIWAFKVCKCLIGTKVGQGNPNDRVYSDSVRLIFGRPNMNAVYEDSYACQKR